MSTDVDGNNSEELYEAEIEDHYLHNGTESQTSEGSTNGENVEFHADTEGQASLELLITELDTSMEDDVQEELSQKALLDSVFGELPPKSLIKINLLFPKPPPPSRTPQTKHSWFFTKVDVADEERSQEATSDAPQTDRKPEKSKKRFVRIGGMLAMPVPVEGPLFADQEKISLSVHQDDSQGLNSGTSTKKAEVLPVSHSQSNYRDIVLYDKYIPELDCYRLALKQCSQLSFPLDFAKPERPGAKRRSKPSDLKRKPWPPPTPEPPPVLVKFEEPPPEKPPPPPPSFCSKLCSICCCCCAPREEVKEAPAEAPVEAVVQVVEATAPAVEPEPPPAAPPLPPKTQKGILKSVVSKEKVPSSKSPAVTIQDTPTVPGTESEKENQVVASFTATTTVVAVVSEPLTTIYRSEEISTVIDINTSEPPSERTELSSESQSKVEKSSLPATTPKSEGHSPVLAQVGEPDKVAKGPPGKEKEEGQSVPTITPAISLPEPKTDTSPSKPTSEKTEQGSPGGRFVMEAASLPLVPARSVPPRPHVGSRRYFALALPAPSPQKKRDEKKSAPLPGRNWVNKFL